MARRTAEQIRQDEEDRRIGMALRAWALNDGDYGDAGRRVRGAINVLRYGGGTREDTINDMAEWLRLATLAANRAANWPENGR